MCLERRYCLLILFVSMIMGSNGWAEAISVDRSLAIKTNRIAIDNSSILEADTAKNGHYVVIGAFKERKNVTNLVDRVRSVGFEPKHFFNEQRGLHYVYIFIYDDLSVAKRVSKKLREVKFIKDAWVFSSETDEPLTEKLIAQVQDPKEKIYADVSKDKKPSNSQEVEKMKKNIGIPNESSENSDTITREPPINSSMKELEAKNTVDSKPSETTAVKIIVPNELAENSDALKQLASAKQGDLVVFDNILFHKNSSVLRKLSKDEIGRLEYVLGANPDLKIKIHGHTNGDFKGEVYLLADNDSRFFKLSGRNKVVKGDDILLSQKRAEVIKRYLVQQGLDASRIETKGWGHKKMLFPKDHLKASQNRRVEIEVLSN